MTWHGPPLRPPRACRRCTSARPRARARGPQAARVRARKACGPRPMATRTARLAASPAAAARRAGVPAPGAAHSAPLALKRGTAGRQRVVRGARLGAWSLPWALALAHAQAMRPRRARAERGRQGVQRALCARTRRGRRRAAREPRRADVDAPPAAADFRRRVQGARGPARRDCGDSQRQGRKVRARCATVRIRAVAAGPAHLTSALFPSPLLVDAQPPCGLGLARLWPHAHGGDVCRHLPARRRGAPPAALRRRLHARCKHWWPDWFSAPARSGRPASCSRTARCSCRPQPAS
jgi:hypothetical protein